MIRYIHLKDTTSGMRAYDRNAIKEFVTNTSLTPEPDTMVYMLKKGLKIKEVQVTMILCALSSNVHKCCTSTSDKRLSNI